MDRTPRRGRQQRKCQLSLICPFAVATGKTGRKRISDIFKTLRRMCVDGPEDRGSIAKYGSPERMPVLSRKERTLPMRKLPAAFAVFRIPLPAEFSACRQLSFDRRTPRGGCLSSFEGLPYCSRTSSGVPTIAAPTPLFCPRSGVHSDVDSQAWLSGVGKLCHVF